MRMTVCKKLRSKVHFGSEQSFLFERVAAESGGDRSRFIRLESENTLIAGEMGLDLA